MADMPIVVFADGAAKGNPGPGGWGAIVVTPDGQVTELGGGARHTTNNRMELTAALEALRHVGRSAGPVAVHTDSAYVIRG
ncbi:MAG: reverse transcriptase-like protein, partial [Deltaproteobacteria bacterium]